MTDNDIVSELNSFKVEVARFTGRVTEWMESTKSYRENLCNKIDTIKTETQNEIDKLCEKLPCKENESRLRNCETKIANMEGKAGVFGAVTGFIAGLLAKLIK